LRERKVTKALQDPEGPGYHGDAPSVPKYASGPEAFKAPARPSSIISVLRRSEMRPSQRHPQGSPCSTRPLLAASAGQTESNKPSFAFHMPLRALPTLQTQANPQLPAQSYTSWSRTAPSTSQQRPPFSGSINFQSAWTPDGFYARRESMAAVQPATAWTTSQSSASQAYTQHIWTDPQIDYLQPKPAGYLASHSHLSIQPAEPAYSQYSSASTHTSVFSGTSASSYPLSTPSPEVTFQIPTSPTVQRVRAKSMINERSATRSQRRMTYHSTPIRQQVAPPPLPLLQTSGITVQPRLKQQAEQVTHAPPREMIPRSGQRRRAQSSSALIPSPDDAARIGPSWHRSKMRQLQ
jgi:hypothetical protein